MITYLNYFVVDIVCGEIGRVIAERSSGHVLMLR